MKPKLIELAEILKQKPKIKERLERLEFGCSVKIKYSREYKTINFQKWNDIYFTHDFINSGVDVCNIEKKNIEKIIGHEPAYHDVLEYLGDGYYISYNYLVLIKPDFSECESNELEDVEVKLSPWPLSEQTDETLDQIISLCKNHAQ